VGSGQLQRLASRTGALGGCTGRCLSLDNLCALCVLYLRPKTEINMNEYGIGATLDTEKSQAEGTGAKNTHFRA
jgi:hypothetical protein